MSSDELGEEEDLDALVLSDPDLLDEMDDSDDYTDDENENVVNNAPQQSFGGGRMKMPIRPLLPFKMQTTQQLVDEALIELNERGGSSVETIKKYIVNKEPKCDEKLLRNLIKRYLKTSKNNGKIEQIKRCFKLIKKPDDKEKKKDRNKIEIEKLREKLAKLKENREKLKESKEKKESKQETTKKVTTQDKSTQTPNFNTKTDRKREIQAADAERTPVKIPKLNKTPAKTVTGKPQANISKLQRRKSISLQLTRSPPRPKTMKNPNLSAEKLQKQSESKEKNKDKDKDKKDQKKKK